MLNQITGQEKRVLHLIAEGKRNTEIAQALNISVSTVQNHIHSIFQKMRVKNRSEATKEYWQALSKPGRRDDHNTHL